MLHDDSLEVDNLVACLSKPFTTDAIPAFAAAAPFLLQLRESMLARRWSEVCPVIKNRFLNAHVEQLAHKLEATDPGLVAFLDGQVEAVRSASRVLPEFRQRIREIAIMQAAHTYMYWKYSRDVLGKPAGLTQTAIERQLGLGYFNARVPFSFPCPNCSADADCEADGVGEVVPDELRMQCRACGHVDQYSKYGAEALASHVLCGCPYCVAETRRVGAELEQLQWNLVPSLVSYVRAEVAGLNAPLAATGQVNAVDQYLVRDFAAFWAMGGHDNFADAVNAWIKQTNPRAFRPYDRLCHMWTLIDALADAGVVTLEATYEAADDQQILEDLMLEKERRFNRDDDAKQRRAEQEQAEAITDVLKGFKLDKPSSLADWLRAVSEVGLFDHWFVLPCYIECRLNPQRLALAAGAASAPSVPRDHAPAPELQAAIALLHAHGYQVRPPDQK